MSGWCPVSNITKFFEGGVSGSLCFGGKGLGERKVREKRGRVREGIRSIMPIHLTIDVILCE
jgi:hypothetical protein